MQDIGLIVFVAKKYLPYCDRAIDFDDLVQSGHLGLMHAKATYKPDKGSWATWAIYHMRHEMRAAIGLRGTKVRPERGAISLDAPITEDGFTLLDTLEAGPVDLQEGIDREQFCQIVRERVNALKDEQQRLAIALVDLGGLTYAAAAEASRSTVTRIRTAQQRAYGALRRDPMIRDLAEAYGLWRRSYEYCGLQAFRHGWISRTEEEAFLLLETKTQAHAEVRNTDEVTRGMQAIPGDEGGSSSPSPATTRTGAKFGQ